MNMIHKVLRSVRNSYRLAGTLLLVCVVLFGGAASAQTFSFPAVTYLDSMKLRDIVSTAGADTITVTQGDFGSMSGPTAGSGFTIKSLFALTNFKVNVQSPDVGQAHDFNYLITYRTIGTPNPASTSVTTSGVDTLSVSYNRDSLALINDKAFNIAGAFHRLKVVIYDVFRVTQTSSGPVYTKLLPPVYMSVPSFVFVLGEVHVQKFMTYTSLAMSTGNVAVTDNINTNGTVRLNWGTALGYVKPAGYEVEWTYAMPGESRYSFRNNATRIFTNNTTFDIPVAQKEGTLVWRVRMVRPDLSDLLSRAYGAWTNTADEGALSSISAGKVAIGQSAHDALNWDLKMTFVEDGKYKQIITYYDGLLKQKQVQTRFNTMPGQAIVAQNLFDFEGRPVISSLPIPVKARPNFSYLPNFLHPSGASQYDKRSYDGLPDTTVCPPREYPLAPLDPTAQSNQYYSRFNTDKTGKNAFIPDAEGYPMTRKILAAENPDKVLFEGQAGAPLQLGNDRQTAYLYGVPLQAELNRYFGQDVGKYNYYRKMITTDNHHQDMFSITDEKGKPVATGLVGTPDTNSLALSVRNSPVNKTFKSNLLPVPDVRMGIDWLKSGSHFVETDANYGFEYRIDYKPFQPCPGIPYRLLPKVYYQYEVIDNCGNIKVEDTGSLGGIGYTTTPALSYAANKSAYLLKGNHVWNKHSFLKMEDVTASVDAYLDLTNGCFSTFDDFLKAEFLKATFPCPRSADPCDNMRLTMIKELYPRAKYGRYQYYDTASKTFAGPAENSIFSQNRNKEGYRYQSDCIKYPEVMVIGGTTYSGSAVRNMTPQQLINIFNDSVAALLLPLHPDYCKLQMCGLINNPYCKVLGGITKAADAAALSRYRLADIAANDPLVQSSTFTAAELSVTPEDGESIDLLAFMKTICGSDFGVVESICKEVNAGKTAADIVNYPVYMQDEYYRNLIEGYTAAREQRLNEKLQALDGTCGPCAAFMMQDLSVDTTGDGQNDTLLFVSGMDSMKTKMDLPMTSSVGSFFDPNATVTADTLNNLTNVDNSIYCSEQVARVIASLENCNVTAAKLNELRDTLLARFCASNRKIASLSYDSLTNILASLGIPAGDLCNAGLADLRKITRRSGDHVQLGLLQYAPLYYQDLTAFLQSAQILDFIASPAPVGSANLRLCDMHPFEQGLAKRLGVAPLPGNCASTLGVQVSKTSLFPSSNAVVLTFSNGASSLEYYLYPLSRTDTNALTASFGANAISSSSNYALKSLFNPYGFDQVGPSFANRNTVLLEFDGIKDNAAQHFRYFLSTFGSGTDYTAMERDVPEYLNGVGCSELLPMTRSALVKAAALGIKAGHPLFETFFTNVMNYDNSINFSFDNYNEAIRSCGLTDSLLIPKTISHFKVKLPASASIQTYIDAVQVGDTIGLSSVQAYELGGYTYLLIDVYSSNNKTILDAKQSLTAHLPVGAGIQYLPYLQRDTVAQLLSSSFSPLDLSGLNAAFPGALINATPITIHYYIPGYGTFSAPGSSLITMERNIADDYTYNHYVDDICRHVNANAPMTSVLTHAESAVSAQYADWQMTAWRTYVRTLAAGDHNALVKGSKPSQFAALAAAGGGYSFGTSAFSYVNKRLPYYRNDLFIDHTPSANANYNYVNQLLANLEMYNLSILKPTPPTTFIPNLNAASTETRAYLCGDTTQFWINHFNAQRKMVNIFIKLPAYLPLPRSSYRIVTARKGFERDSVTYLTLTLAAQGGGLYDTISCLAYCDLTFGRPYVIPSAFLSSHSDAATAQDRLESCEKAKLATLYPTAAINYGLYRDSMRNVLVGQFRQDIIANLKESLNIIGNDIKHGLTLYYYDVAGNLIKTVSPEGVRELSVAGADNDTINAHRVRNQIVGPLVPTHAKVTSYKYNAQNKIIQNQSPDAGTSFSRYDVMGRVTFSQTARQGSTGEWTYYIYDNLSRVIETGAVTNPGGWTSNVYTTLGSPTANVIKANYNRREVTVTLYDTASYVPAGPFAKQAPQDNLKNRISCAKYFDVVASGTDASRDTGYAHALHYSYDISGNVKTLVHDLRTIMRPELRMKRVDYEYDLYSGKVLLAAYNRGSADQFYQRYNYDADNRIVDVTTSGNGVVWDRDAHYNYYEHGPLARTDLGEQRVQGVDYAYTINGWLKATNGAQNGSGDDMSGDGLAGGVVPTDVFSQRMDYFHGDYKGIADSSFFNHLPATTKSLYNGNIAGIATALAPFANLQSAYHYDPLQRIDRARYTAYNYDHTASQLTTAPLPDWASDYSYDKDGNLLKLKRRGGTVPAGMNGGTAIVQHMMDSLTYRYEPGKNRLKNIQDSSLSTAYKIDIPPTIGDTALVHYTYDASGNMTKDLISGISAIDWNRFGKVRSIAKLDGTRLNFSYDALGNRIAKDLVLSPASDSLVTLRTVYVRDAAGNSLAVYDDKKEYDLIRIRPDVIALDPTLGVIGRLPVSWTIPVATGLISAYQADPSQNLAVLALALPQIDAYTSNGELMQSLTSSLNAPQALRFVKSMPVITEHTLGGMVGNAGDDGTVTGLNPELLMRYLEPIMLSNGLYEDQTALLATLKNTNPGIYHATMASVPASDEQKEQFPQDPTLLQIFRDNMDIGQKMQITYQLSQMLAQQAGPQLAALRPVIVAAFSDANTHDAFIQEVPNADLIYDQLRQDAASYVGYRYGLAGSGQVALSDVVAQFSGNAVLTDVLLAQQGNSGEDLSGSEEALATVLSDRFADVFNLAQRSGKTLTLTTAMKGTVSLTHLDPQIAYWFRTQQVLQKDRTSLAEHHIYGSSRLGMQKYLPAALSFEANAASVANTYQSLVQPRPWYSRYGGDLFSATTYATTLNTGTMGTGGMGISAHILGARHYELVNHLGNVQATVLDRATPVLEQSTNRLLGYNTDISTAQDYYPFGMLMPGRYISDTARHCVTQNATVMTAKQVQVWIDVVAQTPRTTTYLFGSPKPIPTIGSLPVAATFGEEVLHLFHYLPAEQHNGGWIARARSAAAEGGTGTIYDINLDNEPSGVSGYFNLHLDAQAEQQTFGLGMTLARDAVAEVRVRQYLGADKEEYNEIVSWTRVDNTGAQLVVPVDQAAVSAGGRTIAEIRFSSPRGRFDAGLVISVRSPWVWQTQWVAESRVVTICEEKDNYRFGFNGMEKDNEAKGIGNSLDFGARIYDSRLGRWLSLDPLVAKYPALTPYGFCANNPLLFIDPDGKDVVLYNQKGQKVATITKAGTVIEKGMENSGILKSYNATKEYFKGTSGEADFTAFENDTKVLNIKQTSKPEGAANFQSSGYKNVSGVDANENKNLDAEEIATGEYSSETEFGSIEWNPLTGGVDAEGNRHSPAMIFIHELKHAKHFKDNLVKFIQDGMTKKTGFGNGEEENAINETNTISKEKANGDGGNGDDKKRTTHGAKGLFKAKSTTSNQAAPPPAAKPVIKKK